MMASSRVCCFTALSKGLQTSSALVAHDGKTGLMWRLSCAECKIWQDRLQGGLLVRLVSGKDLPPADNSGLSDPYVIFKIDGREQRSSIKPQTLDCTWDEKFEWMKVGCLSMTVHLGSTATCVLSMLHAWHSMSRTHALTSRLTC